MLLARLHSLAPVRELASLHAGSPLLRLVNAEELFDGLAALVGAQNAGATDGVADSRLINGVEYARLGSADESRMRATWRRRRGGGAVPLLVVADDPGKPGHTRVLGPQGDGPVRRVRAEALLELVSHTTAMRKLEAVRYVAQEIDRLDAGGVPGLIVRGLGTEHLYGSRLRADSQRWDALRSISEEVAATGWREVLAGLGYAVTELPKRGYVATWNGRPVIVVHPRRSADEFARLDDAGRLPEGALIADCLALGAPFGLLAADSRMRLMRAGSGEAGTTTRYLELDPAALEPEDRPLIGLLAPAYLADGGFDAIQVDARDYGARLRVRLDRALRQDVLPVLGRELGRWATRAGRDVTEDTVRSDLEAAALTFVFRALFLLYAESAGYLPMSNHTYAQRSLTRTCERAAEELDVADPRSTSLWRDITALVEAMRTGQTAWGVPAYNGALFAPDGFDGAQTLEAAQIPDAALAPALVALARDPGDPGVGVDFSGLEISHLGHIYEGLLSLRLSLADRDFRYDADADRYVPASGDDVDIPAGELLWLTDEGGRKGGGVYYTRTELVRHLVRGAVRPAFERHLTTIREMAATDPAAAGARLFDFAVLDPACGSAHFLVEVVDELADQVARLLGETTLPSVRRELDGLRAAAGRTFGAVIEDAALLKRLVLKRCIYGVDVSPMGAEIAKVSLWLSAFVPGLSLAYLDHNVQVGNSLIGISRVESVTAPGTEHGQIPLFGDELDTAIGAAAGEAAILRAIDDRTPDEVGASREADHALRERARGAERVLNLWAAEPLGLAGAREEALHAGREIITGQSSLLADEAARLALEHRMFHWPLAFAEVFARERPGFDVVVGNPPWDEVDVEQLAFFARYQPGLRSLPETERRAALNELKAQRPELVTRLERERERLAQLRAYLGPDAGYASSPGDPDLYKFFCQRYRDLLRPGGRLGVVLPRSVFLAKGSASFREWLVDHAVPTRIDFLVNTRRWAFDSEERYTVALVAAERRPARDDDVVEVAGVARSAVDFTRQAERPGLHLRRSAFGPHLEVPLLKSQAGADLLGKLRSGRPFPFGGGRWHCFAVREFDETNDSKLWQDTPSGRPLWKGESFDQFDPHGAEERCCPPSEEALARARKPRPGSGSLLAEVVPVAVRRDAVEHELNRARVAFRDVSRATDSRTVRACLVPPEHFLTNTAPYLAFVPGGGAREQAACLAVLNSLAFDWQARRFVETHLNFFVLEGLRLPDLDDRTFSALAASAARLSCLDDRFTDFAREAGVTCGPLDPDERTRLRAEIDAHVARAWNLTADELEVIFADFTEDAVPSHYRDVVRARFAELA